jgi:hypothetical protein
MTAAHAFEYEVGPHSPAPVEADLLDDLDNASTAVARLERHRAGLGSTESHDEVIRRHW